MRKLTILLATLVMLPLVTLSASLSDNGLEGTAQVVPGDSLPTGLDQTTGYDCCWIFFFGRWYCIPC